MVSEINLLANAVNLKAESLFPWLSRYLRVSVPHGGGG